MELETIEKTLKTCPFCGSHNVRVNGVIFPSAACEDCKCYGPVVFQKKMPSINGIKW
nr:MAG TPA: restriction alleviation protein [Caudoviricetes sp.]